MSGTNGNCHHLNFVSYNGFGFWYVDGRYKFHMNLGQNLLPENTNLPTLI